MDLSSRLRAIVRSRPAEAGVRELTYEPDTGGYEATLDIDRVGDLLGGTVVSTPFGQCLVVDRRYESDRWHGEHPHRRLRAARRRRRWRCSTRRWRSAAPGAPDGEPAAGREPVARTIFIDLETTGLSGGAGTVAFLVGLRLLRPRARSRSGSSCSPAMPPSARCCRRWRSASTDVDLIVTYNGKTFDVPVMETRWLFHRMELPLDGIPHFDMLHPARRLWKLRRRPAGDSDDGGCRLSTLERTLFDVRRVGDVPGLRDPAALLPVPAQRRPASARAGARAQPARSGVAGGGHGAGGAARRGRASTPVATRARRWRWAGSTSAAATSTRAERCYRRAGGVGQRRGAGARRSTGWGCAAGASGGSRRRRRLAGAAGARRSRAAAGRSPVLEALRQFAAEALAIHHEHRARDYVAARELAMFALEEDRRRRRPAQPRRGRAAPPAGEAREENLEEAWTRSGCSRS